MTARAPVLYARDGDGVGWIVFDDPERSANILLPATQAALAAAISAAERELPAALVVTSGKERIFIAGADVRLLASLPEARAAEEFSRAGQRLFQRLADFPGPVVCAIHGACAGGGFELALACHWRVASDAPVTRIGLPETSLGTIPGWGGCVRLPRLIGVKPAVEHILDARLLPAREALAAGLVHELVPAGELQARAKAQALRLAGVGRPVVSVPAAPVPGALAELRQAVQARTRGRLPAPLAAIDVIAETEALTIAEGLEVEARKFGEVTADDTCRNLIRVFLLREAARKRTLEGWFDAAVAEPPPPIRRVGVVGAGVMGSGVAQWLAAHGCEVVLRDVAGDALARGMAVVRGLFDQAVRRGKLTAGEANAALHRVTTTEAWEGFGACDLVVEAIVEDAEAKRRLFSELAAVVPPPTLLASNTSALPIEEIAGHVPEPARTIGIHFFNPVSRMPLVELVLSRHTSAATAGRALAFVRALGKLPVICRSTPGFLVTRVLFFYLNEAVRCWEESRQTAAIDAALTEFGWPMGPLRLIDEVGVDVTEFIFGELAHYYPTRFRRSTACSRLLAAGLRGRKNGASRGFYRYDDGRERVNDETTAVAGAAERNAAAGDIATRLLRVMVDEAQRCLDEGVVKSADDVDFALLTGAGFPAFRGGLLHWARAAGLLRST